jgi:stage II sporulation protein D
VICYQDQPIVAVFHAASGKYTENARDVWGSDVPYLQSVKSRTAPISAGGRWKADEFKSAFLDEYPGADLSGKPSTWFSEAETSAAGGVLRIPNRRDCADRA